MTREERAARAVAKAAGKAAKREANRESWKHHPANANAAWIERQAELKAASADIVVEPANSQTTGSLDKLRAIMADINSPLYRRLEAAEAVLAYELAPGSLTQVTDEPVAAMSFRFLQAVVDAAETPEALRFKALKCVAAIENARATRINGEQLAEKRELLREQVNAERRRSLIEAGSWPPAVGQDWALDRSDQFEWPDGWPGSWPWPPTDIAVRLDRAARKPRSAESRDALRAKLRAVKARNRPDDWQRLLG